MLFYAKHPVIHQPNFSNICVGLTFELNVALKLCIYVTYIVTVQRTKKHGIKQKVYNGARHGACGQKIIN